MDESNGWKALNLLIHDVRAPLSVAQGYTRLLQQDRLPPDDRGRALAQTMEALGRIGRLCDDAAAYAAGPVAQGRPAAIVEVREVIRQVQAACTALCPGKLEFKMESELTRVVRTRLESTVHSLAVILCAVRRASTNSSVWVTVSEGEHEAQFLLGRDDARAALVTRPPETFDPWRGGHGIALPLACRTIEDAGGRIWTVADARDAIGIGLPAEASVP
jgi:light-regulated signal transduction histidine kinase (bacteriophytochrome)